MDKAKVRIHKLIYFSNSPRPPPLFPLVVDNQRDMDHGQRFHGAFPNSQRPADSRGAIHNAHPTEFRTQPTYECGIHGKESDQPTTNYLPVHSPAWTGNNFGIRSSGVSGSDYWSHPVSESIPQLPPHADVLCVRDPHHFVPLRQ